MGTWGPGLYSNDDALDVKDMFRDMIAYGYSIDDTICAIIKNFDMDPPGKINADAWFALADTSWKYGMLTALVRSIAIELITSEVALAGSEYNNRNEYEKRKNVLLSFMERIRGDMPPLKLPRTERLYPLDWEPCQVYTFRTGDGLYGAFLTALCHKDRPSKYAPEDFAVTSPTVLLLSWQSHDASFPLQQILEQRVCYKTIGIHKFCYLKSNVYEVKKSTYKKYSFAGTIASNVLDGFMLKHNPSTKWYTTCINFDKPEIEVKRIAASNQTVMLYE